MHAVCPRMVEAEGGRVINVSSGASKRPEFGRASYTTTKCGLEAMTESLAHELKHKQEAFNALQLDLSVWTEGYEATLPNVDISNFEDLVIMSDGCLWLAQPFDYTGQVVTIADLRERGVVRPRTRSADRR